jgi:hypothetical protein
MLMSARHSGSSWITPTPPRCRSPRLAAFFRHGQPAPTSNSSTPMALTADTAQDLYSSPAREHPQAEGTFGIGEVSSPGGTVLGEGSLTISVETSDVDRRKFADPAQTRRNVPATGRGPASMITMLCLRSFLRDEIGDHYETQPLRPTRDRNARYRSHKIKINRRTRIPSEIGLRHRREPQANQS